LQPASACLCCSCSSKGSEPDGLAPPAASYLGVVESPSHFSVSDGVLHYHNHPVPKLSYDGRVEVVMGPMFAGKSSSMMRRGRRLALAQKRVLYVKLNKDARYHRDKVVSHDKLAQDAVSCAELSETVRAAFEHDVVCIDEGQFFSHLAEYCDLMANAGKIVIVAMLSATFDRDLFQDGAPMNVMAIASSVEMLTAVCMFCGSDNAENSALIRREDAARAEPGCTLIGGPDMYKAACRRCYMKVAVASTRSDKKK